MDEIDPPLWKARLLNGPFAGQEIFLPYGKSRLGNEALCDFIIANLPDAENAFGFDLTVTEDGIFLSGVSSSVEDQVFINHDRVDSEKLNQGVRIKRKERVSIGGVSFVSGLKSDALEKVSAKKRRDKKHKERQKQTRTKLRPGKLTAILTTSCIVFLLVAGGLFFVMQGDVFKANKKRITPESLSTVTEKLKNAEHLSHIQIHWNGDTSLTLSGYSYQAEKFKQFTDELDALGISYESKVVNMDEIMKNVKFLLTNAGYKNIMVRPGKRSGYVVISGNIVGDQQWEKTTAQMTNDVKGLKGWSVENNQSDFSNVLLGQMKKNHLAEKLAVVDKGQSVIITGSLSSSQVKVLETILDHARISSHSDPEVIYQNIPYSGNLYPEYLPSPVASYGGNEKNTYLILANGIRCGIGTLLPSGYRIIDISDSGITLKRAGLMAHFPIVV